jgi:isocitrate dehydrogenase kinase/phosphatase
MTLASDIARTIRDGFDKHYRLFRETSAAAKQRFERGDWASVREASKGRIAMYDTRVNEAVAVIRETFPVVVRDESLWP